MEKTHQLPISVMIKERRLRWLGHAARCSDNNMVRQLLFATRIPGHVQPVGRPCGTWIMFSQVSRGYMYGGVGSGAVKQGGWILFEGGQG